MDANTAFNVVCPAYAADPAKATFIELAAARTSLNYFGVNYGLAVALRAAHMITLAKTRISGDGGQVTSRSEGDLSISYSQGAGNLGELSLTHYGQQLHQLIKEGNAVLGVTGGNDVGRVDTPYPT